MGLRRMYCFDKLPKGVIENSLLPGGINKGNGLSYISDPGLMIVPESDTANSTWINAEGWVFSPQFPLIGAAVPRMLKILPTVFGAGWTKQCYGARIKVHREESFAVTGSSPNIAFFNVENNTARITLLTFSEILAALGGYFIEGYFEFISWRDGTTVKVDIFLNGVFLKQVVNSTSAITDLYSSGGLAFGLAFRATSTQQRSTSMMFKDIIAYDDVEDYPGSMVDRPGPVRLKPIFIEEVEGDEWTGPDDSLTTTINRPLAGSAADNVGIENNSFNETPLTAKLRVDIDPNVSVLGISLDMSISSAGIGSVDYSLELKEGEETRTVLDGVATSTPTWGLTSPTLDVAADGTRWTIEAINNATIQLNANAR